MAITAVSDFGLVVLTVTTRTGTGNSRRRNPKNFAVYAIPASLTDTNAGTIDLITDSTDWNKVQGCIYSSTENDLRVGNPQSWRSVQTHL